MDTTAIYQHYMNFRAIENDLFNLLRYVDLNEGNYFTTSAEIRKILLTSCQMVEIIGNGILDSECTSLPKKGNKSFPKYFMDSLNEKCSDNISVVTPKIYNDLFEPWSVIDSWWGAYNDLKHNKLESGTFENCLNAICAFYSLMMYITRKSSIKQFWHQSDLIQPWGKVNGKVVTNRSLHNNRDRQIYKWFDWSH
ncbi:hypothetical protein L3V83_03850 [Thiotrichales bacterium 19X7-9]|nr:hypothetical protein [Thiotrichales bacterium 19X7-9]